MRLGGFAAAMAATMGLLLVGTLLLPVNPYVRFQSLADTIYFRAGWIYERIHYDETPIDIVFIGSSRTAASVYPTLLEPALAEKGIDARVVNFSLASSGFDIRDTIVRELFSEHAPKLLVFSVAEAFPRDGHDAFSEIGTVGEVLGAPLIANRNLPGNLLRLPMRQIELALASAAPEAFGRRGSFDPGAYIGTTVNPRDTLDFEDDLDKLDTPEHAQSLARQAARRRSYITPPILPESLAWVEFGVSRSYLADTVEMAREHGTEIAFLFMPFYTGYESPLEEAWLKQYGPVWKANFLKDDPRNYEDSGHLAAAPRVKAAVTEWLAGNITEYMKAEGAEE